MVFFQAAKKEGCASLGLTMTEADQEDATKWSVAVFDNKTSTGDYQRGASGFVDSFSVNKFVKATGLSRVFDAVSIWVGGTGERESFVSFPTANFRSNKNT